MMEENRATPFITKTYAIVDDSSTDNVVSWSAGNNSFLVKDLHESSLHVLPRYFKHCNFSSFVRQLNTYGFRKVDPDRWEFAHECFRRGQKQLLNRIQRRRSSHHRIRGAGSQFWVNRDLEGKLQRLQKDEDNIALEVVQLKKEQESIDREMGELKKRLDSTERRPQEILSFLAAVVDDPGLFTRRLRLGLSDGEKRRRLPYVEHKENRPNLESEGLSAKTSIADRFMLSTNASIGDGFEDTGLGRNGLIVGDFEYSPTDMPQNGSETTAEFMGTASLVNQNLDNCTQKSEFKIDVSCEDDDLGMGNLDSILW